MEPEKVIQSVLDANRFAILATQDDGQPHTSLMAFTPMDGIRYLIVATYRNTLKHCNIMKNNRVAILVENRKESGYATHRDLVLTAHGIASEMQSGDQMHDGEDPNAIVIDPGATSSLTFTFTQPGEIIFGCHVSGHYAAGMRGELVIES